MNRIDTPTPRKPRINLNLPKVSTSDDGVSCLTARVNENLKRNIVISNSIVNYNIEEENVQLNVLNDIFDKEYIKLKKSLSQLTQKIRFPALLDVENSK